MVQNNWESDRHTAHITTMILCKLFIDLLRKGDVNMAVSNPESYFQVDCTALLR